MISCPIALSNSLCAQFDRDGLVCPTKLKTDVFTAGAVDNIDHNQTARNAMDSFHGTAISMVQFPTQEKPGTDRQPILINNDCINRNALNLLPAEYSEVHPVVLNKTDLLAPKLSKS